MHLEIKLETNEDGEIKSHSSLSLHGGKLFSKASHKVGNKNNFARVPLSSELYQKLFLRSKRHEEIAELPHDIQGLTCNALNSRLLFLEIDGRCRLERSVGCRKTEDYDLLAFDDHIVI